MRVDMSVDMSVDMRVDLSVDIKCGWDQTSGCKGGYQSCSFRFEVLRVLEEYVRFTSFSRNYGSGCATDFGGDAKDRRDKTTVLELNIWGKGNCAKDMRRGRLACANGEGPGVPWVV